LYFVCDLSLGLTTKLEGDADEAGLSSVNVVSHFDQAMSPVTLMVLDA
jgi:hypothetical protein